MSSLTQTQLSKFSELLEKLREALTQDIALGSGASAPVALDQSLRGRVSRGDALQQQEMAKASLARNKAHLVRVQRAIKRIEEHDCRALLLIGFGLWHSEQFWRKAKFTGRLVACRKILTQRQNCSLCPEGRGLANVTAALIYLQRQPVFAA